VGRARGRLQAGQLFRPGHGRRNKYSGRWTTIPSRWRHQIWLTTDEASIKRPVRRLPRRNRRKMKRFSRRDPNPIDDFFGRKPVGSLALEPIVSLIVILDQSELEPKTLEDQDESLPPVYPRIQSVSALGLGFPRSMNILWTREGTVTAPRGSRLTTCKLNSSAQAEDGHAAEQESLLDGWARGKRLPSDGEGNCWGDVKQALGRP